MERYVKFLRGTPTAFKNLKAKDKDTFYFITETGSSTGRLFIGDTLISNNYAETDVIAYLKQLEDVNLENLQDGSILKYDEATSMWIAVKIEDIFTIDTMVGATSAKNGKAGLVPVPYAGQEKFFLRGDGQWVKVESEPLKIDEKIFKFNESKVLSLQGFAEALAGSQLMKGVDGNLSWVKPDTSIIDNLSSTVENLELIVNQLADDLKAIDTGFIKSTSDEFFVTETGELTLKEIKMDKILGLSSLNNTVNFLNTIVTAPENGVLARLEKVESGANSNFVTKTEFTKIVGNIGSLMDRTTTIDDDIIELQEMLTWKDLTD